MSNPDASTCTLEEILLDWQEQRRRSILSELAFLEKKLIAAGRLNGPTTSDMRRMWREDCFEVI
jgi:hypothetical protein